MIELPLTTPVAPNHTATPCEAGPEVFPAMSLFWTVTLVTVQQASTPMYWNPWMLLFSIVTSEATPGNPNTLIPVPSAQACSPAPLGTSFLIETWLITPAEPK